MSQKRSELDLLRAVIDTQRLIHARSYALDEVLEIVTDRSADLTVADGAMVALLDGPHLVLHAGAGVASEYVGSRLDAGSTLAGRCATERRALRCDDSEVDDRVDLVLCTETGARSLLSVPLLLPSGECIGVLGVMAQTPGAFADSDVEVLDAMADFVATAVRHAHETEERAGRALHDGLTGLANRSLLLDHLALGLARARRSDEPVTVLFLDLDRFRGVNDVLGHDAGDAVLRAVGTALVATVRPSDTVARLAVDQFVVVCEGVALDVVPELVDRLRWAVACAWAGELPITSSVGVARSVAGESAEQLLARAGDAMREVKRAR